MALTPVHSPLTALSPLDGRYQSKVAPLRPLFSEWALIRFRVMIEVEWLKTLAAEPTLAEVPPFSSSTIAALDALVKNFSEADGEAVKAIEAKTNHDVKAVEYFLRDRLAGNAEIIKTSEFIHFACTSEDINNLCHALMLKHARSDVMLPALDSAITRLTCIVCAAHAPPSPACHYSAKSTARSETTTRTWPRIQTYRGKVSRARSSNTSASNSIHTRYRSSRTILSRNYSMHTRE